MNKKARRRIAIPLLLFLISLGLLFAAVINRYGKAERLNKLAAHGNELLASGDKNQAEAVYKDILSEDPDNSAAYEGLMQLAYELKDRQLLTEYYDRWLDIQIAKGNTSDSRIDRMGLVINDMERRKELNGISDLIVSGDQEAAEEALKSLAATGKNAEADRAYADMMIYLAGKCADLKNYEQAADYLNKALPYASEEQNAGELLYRIQEERIKAALEDHDITAAADIVKQEGIEGYDEQIRREKERAEHFTSVAEEIRAAFENEDTDALYGLLNDEELKADSMELKKPYITGGQAMGAGSISFYRINNRLYVYYGTIKERSREGDGKWVYISSDGRLVIYTLTFKGDKPEGEGSCDRFSAPSEEEGAVSVHEHDDFYVNGGVMDGRYSMKTTVTSEWPYDYSVEYDLKDGYCPPVEPGEYPDLIDLYLSYPAPLAGWSEATVYDPAWKKEYTTTIWFNWTPARWVVEGIVTGVAPAAIR